MITEETIRTLVEGHIRGSGIFLVDVVVKQGNTIRVHVDTPEGISIDRCVEISRFLNEHIDREAEDYSLEVSSPGLGSPFKVKQQYEKNVGREVEVLLSGGLKKKGKLLGITDEMLLLEVMEKAPAAGNAKKKKRTPVKVEIQLDEIKTTKAIISFK